MTYYEEGEFIASFILGTILVPLFIILMSTFLTGDMLARKVISLVIFIYSPLTLLFLVLGAWMDKQGG